MEKERNYVGLLNDAIKIAFLSFRNFLINLDINPNAFSHIFNATISIDYTEDITNGACALFDPNAPQNRSLIYVGIDYLDDMYNFIYEGYSREKILVNIANSIVHELIHMCRVVTLKEEVSILNLKNKIIKEADIYHEYYQKIRAFDDILMLSKPTDSKCRYAPIKVYIYGNNKYSIIVFDKKNLRYLEYKKQSFKAAYKGNTDKLMDELVKELSTDLRHIPNQVYPCLITLDVPSLNIYNSMDLYHGSIKKEFKGITSKTVADEKRKEIVKKIKYQISLEEAITETLANIIIMSRNKNYIDLNDITDKIISSKDSLPAEKCAACFIKCCGIEKIKDFLLAPYSDEFKDVFREFFKEDYDKAIYIFDILFNKRISNEYQVNLLTNELLQIISKRKTELLV